MSRLGHVPRGISGPPRGGRAWPNLADDELLAPGETSLVEAGLVIGLLLMAMQLWLLTVALDLMLGGRVGEVWSLAAVSGLIFLGGLGICGCSGAGRA